MPRVTVHFATSRACAAAPGDPPSYGNAMVAVNRPQDMTYGVAFIDGVTIAGATGPADSHGTIDSLNDVQTGGFPRSAIDDLSRPGENILLFIHGFDNSFSDALTRAAFNREWLAASGQISAATRIVSFSWPSLGQLLSFPLLPADYLRDQATARQSGAHIMAFLANLAPLLQAARASGACTVLLAHSMGNLALQAGVESWFAHGNGDDTLFNLAILAAGDCGDDTFSQLPPMALSGLPRLARRIAVCFSHVDAVLQLSMAVNLGAQRLGQDGARHRTDLARFPADTFTFVDCTAPRDYAIDFLTSHQYYRMSPIVRAQIAAEIAAACPGGAPASAAA